MNIIRTKDFERDLLKLPKEARRLFGVQKRRFTDNWQDARLHTKKLHGFEISVFSFRVTRNWRVLFYFQNKATVIFFEIDNRKDVYR